MVICSAQIQKYFDSIDLELKRCHSLAQKARALNFDPEPFVEIKLAKNMAERVEGLISVVAPQLINSGVTERIIDLEKQYAPLDWRIALIIAHEVAEQKFCKFKDKKEAIEIGIRTGFAYQTGGIVSAPLEGFIELKIKKTADGKEYFSPCYAGPIRGAGGTAAAFSLIIVDYVRVKMGYAKYDPTENEINRYKIEIQDYHERVTNLQYFPSPEEIDFLARHTPIQIDGDPTEKFEVSNYKDIPRIETNRIRGGICLVLAEGLSQKAAKIWKRLAVWGKELDLDWSFLDDFLKLQKQVKARKITTVGKKEKITPNYTFIADIVAGRPILTYPMRDGGFRLRYGRARTTGFSASAINPATMYLLRKYIAIGTQLKMERPGKASAITSCDQLEGPIVKLTDGSVMRIDTIETALQFLPTVEKILFMGDILFNYGDFSENGHILVPAGYNEEWYLQELKKSWLAKCNSLDPEIISLTCSIEKELIQNLLNNRMTKVKATEAILISKQCAVPLHPQYTYHWRLISNEDFLYLYNECKKAKIIIEENKIIKIIFEKNNRIKLIIENIGLPHLFVTNEYIVIEKDDARAFAISLGLVTENNTIIYKEQLTLDETKSTLENINLLSSIQIRDKSGTFIGARMGRPEKAKMRKLNGSPQVLFPVGEEGARLKSIQSAIEAGKINADFPIYFCNQCTATTIYKVCHRCYAKTEKRYYCKECGILEKAQCIHGEAKTYQRQDIDINEYIIFALKKLKTRQHPDLIKGVRGTSNKDHIPENMIKGILRAKHDVYVNKDGTIRYDMSELPITHFKPKEIGTSVEKLKTLGYLFDIHHKELLNDDQILELKTQDLILPASKEALDETSVDVLFRVANFIDELLVEFYNQEPFYNLQSKQDLVGQLVLALAPHISAGMIGRIIGFSKTQGMFAHPLFHAGLRRDCDGDEASVSLLLDCFLNFSGNFLPNTRGAKTMDAPLVLTSLLNPSEVDDQALGLDTVWEYPLELYEAALEYKSTADVAIEQIKKRLGTEKQYEGMGFTHDTSDLNLGISCSAYKALPSMTEKLQGQMEIAKLIRAVDETDVAKLVIEKHFLKDTKGNLRKFSQQTFRCVKCNEIFRRPPLMGKCNKCQGRLLFTVTEGSVTKYLEQSITLANDFNIPNYLKQTLDLLKTRIESVFGKDPEKQEGLDKWFAASVEKKTNQV